MASNSKAQSVLDSAIQDVVDRDEDPRPLIIRAPRASTLHLPGYKEPRHHVQIKAPTKVQTVKEGIIRIQQEADPIGFLIAVQNGVLMEVTELNPEYDKEGKPTGQLVQTTSYAQASIPKRVEVARFLANKVLPTLSVTKHVIATDETDDKGDDMVFGKGGPSFAQVVAEAANRAAASVVEGMKNVERLVEVADLPDDVEEQADDNQIRSGAGDQ